MEEAESGEIYDIFNEDDTEVVLIVDVLIAFNSINKEVPHYNTKALCPAWATFISNCSLCLRR